MRSSIKVHGARVNNLRGIDVEIPKHALTVVTGVSGSGKSSLVFDTIAAESRRLINETYSSFVQGFMPSMQRPDVDLLEGLSAAIIVDQQPLGTHPRSTVGTATDVTAMLRVLYSRVAQPRAGGPGAYSFNVPSASGAGSITVGGKKVAKTFSHTGGMCPECEGTGRSSEFVLEEILDRELSLSEGALNIPGYKTGGWNYRMYTESGLIDPDKPIKDYSQEELHNLLHHEPTKKKIAGVNMTYEGLISRLRSSMLSKDREAMQKHIREFVDRAVTFIDCPACDGTRLAPHALESRINGLNIAEVCAMEIHQIPAWLDGLDIPSAAPLISKIKDTIQSFIDVGLDYLSLNRPVASLSGGEAQRAKLIRYIGCGLSDMIYAIDEPTAGLHPSDIARVNDIMLRLRDAGNTLIVVEHKPETIAIADYIVDIGPGAGSAGGRVEYAGPASEFSATLTSQHLAQPITLNDTPASAKGSIALCDVHKNNVQGISIDIPRGVLTAVTGVAGSGKSSLLSALATEATFIDQSPISASSRSNPGTYTGALDGIRKAFAKAHGLKPGLFSANSEGACPHCKGAGFIRLDFGFMAGAESTCEICEGKRFDDAVLTFTLGGLNISQVMQLSAAKAQQWCAQHHRGAAQLCQRLVDVGLGYIQLGQSLSTLSGGERQRLKLAAKLDENSVLVIDEPSTGLHMADTQVIISMLRQMVEQGRTVIVIEHNLHVIAGADHIIDLGPGAGSSGGQVIFEGSPLALSKADTPTGRSLRTKLQSS